MPTQSVEARLKVLNGVTPEDLEITDDVTSPTGRALPVLDAVLRSTLSDLAAATTLADLLAKLEAVRALLAGTLLVDTGLVIPATFPLPSAQVATLTPQTDALTDTELRAAQVPVTDEAAEFWRIKNRRFEDTEEVRYDIAADLVNGDIYAGVAPDGTSTATASWTVIRTYFDANGNPSRERIRTGVAWDSRTVGW